MATYTPNYNLKKPAGGENALVGDLSDNMDIIDSELGKLSADLAITQFTDTATQDIARGTFVVWKGNLYTASEDITSGDTLSASNLTAIADGGLNALQNMEIRSVTYTYTAAKGARVGTNLKTLIDADLPAGKICIGIAGFDSGTASAIINSVYYGDNNYSLSIRNVYNGSLTNKTATIYYLAM